MWIFLLKKVNLTGRWGISSNTAGSLSTALLWKLSHRNFQFPRTWNYITYRKLHFKTHSRKLGKNYFNLPKQELI